MLGGKKGKAATKALTFKLLLTVKVNEIFTGLMENWINIASNQPTEPES